jgi:hypothetical protein
MRKTKGRFAVALLLLATASVAREASAYCRKTTCRDCPLDPDTGCPTGGVPISWSNQCVSYALSRIASKQVGIADATAAAAEAFLAWESVTCPGTGEPPSILATEAYGLTGCNLHEYSRNGVNANVILFRDDEWPYPQSEDAVGLTSTTYDEKTGQILDADIEINSTLPLSTGNTASPDGYDLLSVLTHEAGHFLGLAHSNDPFATMQPIYEIGSVDFRTPSDDDIAGICAIYPPHRDAKPCDFSPRGGFATECALGVTSGGCSVGRGQVDGCGALLAAPVLALGAIGRRRARRRAVAARAWPKSR